MRQNLLSFVRCLLAAIRVCLILYQLWFCLLYLTTFHLLSCLISNAWTHLSSGLTLVLFHMWPCFIHDLTSSVTSSCPQLCHTRDLASPVTLSHLWPCLTCNLVMPVTLPHLLPYHAFNILSMWRCHPVTLPYLWPGYLINDLVSLVTLSHLGLWSGLVYAVCWLGFLTTDMTVVVGGGLQHALRSHTWSHTLTSSQQSLTQKHLECEPMLH